jgi:uncharacterized protein YbjT (DUF2867 family)
VTTYSVLGTDDAPARRHNWMGGGKTSPISAVDVARAVAAILDDPAPHIGQIYDLTGPESADLDHYARVFSEALGRPIRYRDVPLPAWSAGLRQAKFPEHLGRNAPAWSTRLWPRGA